MRSYRMRVAAELSGLSPETIRAWERRYGIPRPRRTAGGFRVYTEAEIALLSRLRALTAEGMAIGDAVKLASHLRDEIARDAAVTNGDGAPVVQWRDAVLAAAARLDQAAVDAVFDEALSALSPLQVYDTLVVPVQREVARHDVAEEHLVTQVIRARLLALLRTARGAGGPHVVCACFPEEQHEVGLVGAALRFRHAGFRVTFLGARTPVAELVRVMRTLRPEVVALSCVTDPGARAVRRVFEPLRAAAGQGTRIVGGGPGLARHRSLCTALGVRLVHEERDWPAVLRMPRRLAVRGS